MKAKTIINITCLFLLLTILPVIGLEKNDSESEQKIDSDAILTKSKLNFEFSMKDTLTSESESYGLKWAGEFHHAPYEFFDSKYKVSLEVFIENSESETSTEIVDIRKYGVGMKLAAIKTSTEFKPFVSFALESLREDKVTDVELIRNDFDATYKWGVGFTFPLKDVSGTNTILGLELGYYKNFDNFPIDDEIFSETKITLVFDYLAWLNSK